MPPPPWPPDPSWGSITGGDSTAGAARRHGLLTCCAAISVPPKGARWLAVAAGRIGGRFFI